MEINSLREQIIGIDSTFPTPFGERLLVYCDYTASGRGIRFIENYLLGLQRHYANTHTEDDVSGRSMTHLLHEAERRIKEAVNAGEGGCIIACGTGATAAIGKLQQILGVALPPATAHMLRQLLAKVDSTGQLDAMEARLRELRPVVFVGPYEHHSNEVSWREGLADVVEVDLSADGSVDLAHLERLLRDPQYDGRTKIGSFSAASNVTGMISPVADIARLLHRYDTLACFDFAASGPYVEIDMSPQLDPDGGDPSLDAIFLSPHKFLGGPGSSGVLVFKRGLYDSSLAPTVGGGGTVDYVGPKDHAFLKDIEAREKAGTPGVLQILRAALAIELKHSIGISAIASREHELLSRAMGAWAKHPRIEILGNSDPERRVAIVSFNLREPEGAYLHPKFVTRLANDLFGIQSRAGCSCAGPYGHRLLHIGEEQSQRYREWITRGYEGIKPGWCRIGFHYAMDDVEADYVIRAVEFLAEKGHLFLPLYRFDPRDGGWNHEDDPNDDAEFSVEVALASEAPRPTSLDPKRRREEYDGYLREAERHATELSGAAPAHRVRLEGEAGELQFFALPDRCLTPRSRGAG